MCSMHGDVACASVIIVVSKVASCYSRLHRVTVKEYHWYLCVVYPLSPSQMMPSPSSLELILSPLLYTPHCSMLFGHCHGVLKGKKGEVARGTLLRHSFLQQRNTCKYYESHTGFSLCQFVNGPCLELADRIPVSRECGW